MNHLTVAFLFMCYNNKVITYYPIHTWSEGAGVKPSTTGQRQGTPRTGRKYKYKYKADNLILSSVINDKVASFMATVPKSKATIFCIIYSLVAT